MSKRPAAPTGNLPRSSFLHCSFLTCLALIALASNSSATTATVTLEKTHSTIGGTDEFVDLTLDNGGSTQTFGGFSVLISYDPAALTVVSVEPGELLNSCNWEYFTYLTGPGACSGSCPPGVLKIVAIASSTSVSGDPSCFLDQASGTLATIKFHVADGPVTDCQAFPLQFYWSDCGDNAFSNQLGDSLLVADTVFSWFLGPVQFHPTPTSLGTVQGLPDSCLVAPIGSNPATRAINFVEGAIDVVCPDDPSSPGDLNLNGISYEIADLMLYADYFLRGLAALDPNPIFRQQQIINSDCNADSVALQYRDLAYLYRVIIGDALPFPKPVGPNLATAQLINNTIQKTVTLNTTDPLCMLAMTFSGTVVPTFENSGMVFYDTTYSNTGVIIFPQVPNTQFSSGNLLTYTGNGHLTGATAVDWFDTDATTMIQIESVAACGDVDASGTSNISDCVYLISYIFGGGSAPQDDHNGDANCDGMTNVSDAVYLLQYIFGGGPAPCSNCP